MATKKRKSKQDLQKLLKKFNFTDYRTNQVLSIINDKKEIAQIEQRILHKKTRAAEHIYEILVEKLRQSGLNDELRVFLDTKISGNAKTCISLTEIISRSLAIDSNGFIDYHSTKMFFEKKSYDLSAWVFAKELNEAWKGFVEIEHFEGHEPHNVMCFNFKLLINS